MQEQFYKPQSNHKPHVTMVTIQGWTGNLAYRAFSRWADALSGRYMFFLNIYIYMKSSFPKRYKSILIVFMKITFFYLDPYILLIFNLSC